MKEMAFPSFQSTDLNHDDGIFGRIQLGAYFGAILSAIMRRITGCRNQTINDFEWNTRKDILQRSCGESTIANHEIRPSWSSPSFHPVSSSCRIMNPGHQGNAGATNHRSENGMWPSRMANDD